MTQAPPQSPAENPNQHPSRRDVRKHYAAKSPAAFQTPAVSAAKKKRKSSFLSLAVTAVIVPGLFATVALPAYAFAPAEDTDDLKAAVALEDMKTTDAQTVLVDSGAAASTVSRDAFAATTEAELAATKKRSQLAATYASYTGPSAADFLANPPYPSFDLGQVASVGQQYLGTPYVYGGATPSGFDCSGFVMFVYAQFGISLAHSVRSQAASGTVIDPASAMPGDLVIFSDGSHDGIYAGNGNVLHAPYEGASVRVQPIWDSVYYVRLGI